MKPSGIIRLAADALVAAIRMSRGAALVLIMALPLLGAATAQAQVSFSLTIGSGSYYQPVGDYDYLPYAYQTNPSYAPPTISFHDMMDQYGTWVTVEPFGQVWRPYASQDWRPYTYGHWVYTQQYGQMWEGYEPWAWAGYHYGNWIFDRRNGWVWIPGYDWHPGRVIWARSYGTIGWMPEPPDGFDYSRGYLSQVGPNNQFSYNDDDFGEDFGPDSYSYGGPYYSSGYRDMYYNRAYTGISVNLWVFIDDAHYGDDNYADYTLGGDYTQNVFNRKLVRITNRPIDRPILERVVGVQIQDAPVEVRQLQTDKQAIQVVVPTGSVAVDRIRKHSNEVVRQVIAPGFVEKKREFKGQASGNRDAVSKVFGQESVPPKVEAVPSRQIIDQANAARQNRDQMRAKLDQANKDKLARIEKEGKVKPPKNTQQDQQQSKDNKGKGNAQDNGQGNGKGQDRGQGQDKGQGQGQDKGQGNK